MVEKQDGEETGSSRLSIGVLDIWFLCIFWKRNELDTQLCIDIG